jgi:hypothetical protein
MNIQSRWLIVCFAVGLSIYPERLSAQITQLGSSGQVGDRFKDVPALPVPRYPDGRVRLDSAGQAGMWLPYQGALERLTNADDADTPGQYPDRPRLKDVPFQPWARALLTYRQVNQFEPHTRCKPSGGPRQFMTPYGVQFVDLPELHRVFIFDEGGPHTYRTVYMDQMRHPDNLASSHYGHSIGHWEGDTLVVDTRGFNEGFWLDRSGLPHTEQLHMIERFTRTDSKTMKYEVTMEDPGAYTRPWTGGFLLGLDPDQELFEYVCQDNNQASGLMVGAQNAVDRTSLIVP